MTITQPTRSCEASDLVIAHQAFRRLYSLTPDAVRRTQASDRRRIKSLAATLTAINGALHHHHSVEDELLWDNLSERRPACGLHVELMKRQHGMVAGLLDGSPALIDAWRREPSAANAEALAARFEEIDAVLTVHLQAEEAKILPVIQQVISQQEWDQVGEAAKSGAAPRQGLMMIGLVLDLMPADERASFEAELPGPAKFVWALVGRRYYQRIMADLVA